MNKNEIEKRASKLFKQVLQKIFEGKIDESCIDIHTIFVEYPETLAALKGFFLLSLISLTYLNSNCILTEYFYTGLKKISDDGFGGFFNSNKKYFQSYYDIFSQKRLSSYKRFKLVLNELFDRENLYVINMPVNLSADKFNNARPMIDLICLKDANQLSENKLKTIISDLTYSILVSLIAESFHIEYTDQLDSFNAKKLDRVQFYHTCMLALLKFRSKEKDENNIELVSKCCRYILGLTTDSGNSKRQDAYETIASISQNYHNVFVAKEPLMEIECDDLDVSVLDSEMEESLISLVTSDQKNDLCYSADTSYENTKFVLEFNELPEIEIFLNQDKNICNDSPSELKLEFE